MSRKPKITAWDYAFIVGAAISAAVVVVLMTAAMRVLH